MSSDRTLGDLAVQLIDHIDPSETPQVSFHHYSLPSFDAGKRPQFEIGMSIKSGKLRVADGTVLFSKLNPGSPKVWRIPKAMGQHAIASTEFLVLQPRTGITLNALYAACLNPGFLRLVAAKATGTIHQRVRPSDLLATKLHLGVGNADLAEIGDFIATLDDKIELNRRMNATLEAIVRALFQSWFVDFDPVRAKAEGRQPVGMDADTATLFPDSFEESALGLIPKGWEVTNLGHLIGVLNGFAFKSQDWRESGVPVVKIGSVKSGYIDLNEGSFVSEEVASAASRFALQVGDMLIGMTGYVGEVGIMYDSGASPLLNQRVGKFEFNQNDEWTMEVCYPLLRHPRFKQFVIDRSVGSAQANVSSSAILEFPVIKAAKLPMQAFSQAITPLVRKLIANYQEIAQCRKNRDALLPKLLSGELRVGDVAA